MPAVPTVPAFVNWTTTRKRSTGFVAALAVMTDGEEPGWPAVVSVPNEPGVASTALQRTTCFRPTSMMCAPYSARSPWPKLASAWALPVVLVGLATLPLADVPMTAMMPVGDEREAPVLPSARAYEIVGSMPEAKRKRRRHGW